VKGPRERSHLHAAPVACAHCGLAVPEGMLRPGEEKQFCCNGCRQVHDLIRDWGYEKFYGLVEQQGGVLEPARPTGRAFEDLDDPRALEGSSDEEPGGRCRTRLYLEGVHCAACVWLVEKLPEALDGVDSVRLNLASAVAEVTWRPGTVKLSAIARALDRLGYSPHVHRAGAARDARRAEDRATLVKLGVAAAGAMNLMFLHGALYAGEASGMASPYETFFRWVSLGIALPVLAFSARPFFQTAYAGLKSRFVHIDLPVAIGIAVTFAASAANVVRGSGPVYFDSLAMLVAALLGARQAQRAAQRAALERADSLRGVAFLEFARRLEGDGPLAPAVEVPVAALAPGDRVEVRSGELVPADGVVLFGRSTLDGSVLTGESAPVPVTEGGAVWAGVTNLGARLVVKVEAAGEKTRVGALLAVVEDALARRPAVLRRTDLLARRFVQALLLLAAAALLLALPLGTEAAVGRVVALLVVACPCALGLSVPLAVSVGLMRAARAGIFVKDPDALDRLRRVGTVLLDKTGTLTEGKATFARYLGDEAALELATTLEAESSHAVAHALRASLGRRVNVVREVTEVREVAGRGISGVVDGRRLAVGNRAHVEALAAPAPGELAAHAEALVADGFSPLWVAVDGRVVGVGGIGDPLRADARATVDALRARGVRVRILSGDDPRVVASVAARLGIAPADALGGRTPEEKRDVVASLVGAREGEERRAPAVVMVGDGVNDAAALALADVGVAVLGGKGASLVAADVVLTREGVAPLLDLLHGSRRVFGVIRRNLAFSLLYNAAGAALALLGLVGPLLAAVLMPVSSLSVVLSSALSRPFPAAARRAARTHGAEA